MHRLLPATPILVLCCCALIGKPVRAEEGFTRFLERRVEANPDDASAWRSLGRLRLEAGDVEDARAALEESVRIEPLSAAGHFDLGRVLARLDEPDRAIRAFERVLELAPDTEYAVDADRFLSELPRRDGVVPVDYEIKRFDNSDIVDDRLPDPIPGEHPFEPVDDYGVWVEVGALYNTNVALAPSSRELSPGERDSFQFHVSPDVEWRALNTESWRIGPSFAGNFSVNESSFSRFNLTSFEPGLFAEHEFLDGCTVVIPRVDYGFTRDAFDGTRFADRHRLVTSVARLAENGDAWFVHWTADHTDFADDGTLPDVTSQDGWANAISVSRDWKFAHRHFEMFRLGLDLQRADTEGSDFRYHGLSVFARGILPICPRNQLVLDGSLGFRDYFAYEFEPSRNEVVYRAAAELRHYVNDDLWVSAVFEYDRFDSDNALFAADRVVVGLLLTYVR